MTLALRRLFVAALVLSASACASTHGGFVDARGDSSPALDAVVPLDAAMTDVVSHDVGLDGGSGEDAGGDAFSALDAPPSCPLLAPRYAVARASDACESAASVVTFTPVSGGCFYDVGSERRGDIQGVLEHTGAVFEGGLTFPDMSRLCVMALVPAGLALSCGECSVDLVPLP